MKTTFARTLTTLLLLAGALPARAVLQDRGPVDPTLGFPTWYRDTKGTALELCTAQTPSPNPLAGGAPMCFPRAADPVPPSFAGNLGPELFYASANAALTGANGFSMKVDLALEASYTNGVAVRGTEMVFARVRVVMSVSAPGTYTVYHPYGVEVFPDVQPGKRAVFFTQDVGLTPGAFDDALGGRVGPFLQWDFLNVGEQLDITLPNGTVESYLGDPNLPHTVTGSPFDTNFIRVEGPPGSGLGGLGQDWVETPLFNVVGKRYLKPIPTKLAILRASYSRDTTWTGVDVHASGPAAAQLLLTGADLPTAFLTGDGKGAFFSHGELPSTMLPPDLIVLSDVTPGAVPTAVTSGVTDLVTVTQAIYDPMALPGPALRVVAETSDHTAIPPELKVLTLGLPATTLVQDPISPWIASALVPLAAGAIPPSSVTVLSSVGGVGTSPVVSTTLGVGAPPGPVANPDAATAAENATTAIDVLLNDTGVAQRVLLAMPPAHGTATWNAATRRVDYAPTRNYFGADSFSYVVQDAAGLLSNAASVAIDVQYVNQPPVAVNDSATLVKDTVKTFSLVANDVDPDGTVNPASIVLVGTPTRGTVTVNGDGTVTYRPFAGQVGTDQFGYTVKDNLGTTSNLGVVSILITSSPESLSLKTAQWTVSQSKWTIVGQSTVFGAGIANMATAYIGTAAGGTVIGSAPIDAAGKFQIVPPPGSVPGPDATKSITVVSTGGGKITTGVSIR
jgi:hypothetical protein